MSKFSDRLEEIGRMKSLALIMSDGNEVYNLFLLVNKEIEELREETKKKFVETFREMTELQKEIETLKNAKEVESDDTK